MSTTENLLPRDLRFPVLLVFVGTSIALLQLLLAVSSSPLSLFDPFGAYAIGITGLYAMTSLAAILRRWALFLCAGAALFTLNTAVTFAAPGGGLLELMGLLGAPCLLRWTLAEYGGLYGWNAFVFAASLAGMVVFWRALARRLKV